MLKHGFAVVNHIKRPAAFGRLCVETMYRPGTRMLLGQPPSGGCVLKRLFFLPKIFVLDSRLRAAVC